MSEITVNLDKEFERLATAALTDVMAERAKQIAVWGFDEKNDSLWKKDELFVAGMCYRAHALGLYAPSAYDHQKIPKAFPWSPSWWKPEEPRAMLIKAGALIMADMNRLGRASRSTANRSHWLGIVVGEIVGLVLDAGKKEAA